MDDGSPDWTLGLSSTDRVAALEQIREELENFLNDDGDMRDLYLTRKLNIRQRKLADEAEAAAEEEGPEMVASQRQRMQGQWGRDD